MQRGRVRSTPFKWRSPMTQPKRAALVVAVFVFALASLFPSTVLKAQTNISPASFTWATNCKGPNGEYSRGAVLQNAGFRYVCVNVRSREWTSVGVTWVRVEVLGSELVLSRSSAPVLCERTENGRY